MCEREYKAAGDAREKSRKRNASREEVLAFFRGLERCRESLDASCLRAVGDGFSFIFAIARLRFCGNGFNLF